MTENFSLIRDFAIIMAVAGAALVLFRRLGQPAILGYLLAGLVVGPYTLPNPPVQDADTVRSLADLGLVLLLFAVGLEFGWERIRRIGLRVVLIAAVEMSFMIALEYQVGLLLGWSATEAFFLGAAMAISSSAVLVKVLRDTGKLYETSGRLIVGVLVVEDFAAVVLLSVLSGIATSGTASARDVGLLLGKLGIFAMSALILGTLLAPRLIRLVARFRSQETLLVTSLALCFGLALVAEQLGISAAAGAFLIGTVLGDTEQSEEINHIMAPVRDMFAALFFVSIGMLVDLSLVRQFVVPALIVSAVFMLGKIVANTAATFVVGNGERDSLRVGMGMPQIGEFSLAMVKVGRDHGAVGGFLYPVVTVTTAITALLYPFVFRSTEATAGFLQRTSPRIVKQYVANLSVWLTTLRSAFNFTGEATARVRGSVVAIVVNLGIILVLIAVATAVQRFTEDLLALVPVREETLGLLIAGTLIALCVPSVIVIWRSLRTLTDALSRYILQRLTPSSRQWEAGNLRAVLRDTMFMAIVALVGVWSLPFVLQSLMLGYPMAPVPVVLVALMVLLMVRAAFKIHRVLEDTFSRTFLGQDKVKARKEREE